MGWRAGRAIIVPGFILIASAAHAGQLDWKRGVDWVPGFEQGSTINNPGPAAGGSFVWRYESIDGGGSLGSLDPWYRRERELLKWDGLWWETGVGAWSRGDDASPPIMQDRIIHNLHTSAYQHTPVVSWINPLGDGTQVEVSGSLTLRWTGVEGLGFPVDVDVVVAFEDASTGEITPLFSGTYSKPIQGPSVNDEVLIPIELSGALTFDAGDALLVTHRGHDAFGPAGMWVTVFDDVNLTLVPTPGSVALLGVAGLLIGFRRKR